MTVPPAFSAEGAKKVEISRSLSRLGSDWSGLGEIGNQLPLAWMELFMVKRNEMKWFRLLGSLMALFLPPLEKVELRTESQSEGTGEEERTSIEALRGGLERRVLSVQVFPLP